MFAPLFVNMLFAMIWTWTITVSSYSLVWRRIELKNNLTSLFFKGFMNDGELKNLYSALLWKLHFNDGLQEPCERYIRGVFFNCRLNKSRVEIRPTLSERLFKSVDPATQKAQSPNIVQDDRLGTRNLTRDVDADRSVDRLSPMTSGRQKSAV